MKNNFKSWFSTYLRVSTPIIFCTTVNILYLFFNRQEWDRFAVPENTPGGSRIPSHFVTPEEPSSEKWSRVLKDT